MAGVITNPELPETDQTLVELQLSDLTLVENRPNLFLQWLSSPPTNGSYQTPITESVTRLVPVPEDVQLPSLTSSKEEAIPVPPPHATTPGCEVSGQRCWTHRKFDKTPGAGASGRFFWRASGLRGKDRARPSAVVVSLLSKV